MNQKNSSAGNTSKLAKPTGLPQLKGSKPVTSTVPAATLSSSRAQNALEKSVRAAGLSNSFAEQYATSFLASNQGGPDDPRAAFLAIEYKIGDRVWVGGNKPGVIAFIGETRFAQGEWAGIVLDQPIGKNDGSLNGVRYFQCEPKRGLFSKTDKLSREPSMGDVNPPEPLAAAATKDEFVAPTPIKPLGSINGGKVSPNGDPAPLVTSTPFKAPLAPAAATASQDIDDVEAAKAAAATAARRPSGLVQPGFTGSQTNLNRGSSSSPSGSVSNLSLAPSQAGAEVKLGDRVLVGGTKSGIVRYIGTTDFASGEWVGVELDEPQGKNNGSVSGKRYFQCKNLHGLFAPLHRVTLNTGGGGGGGAGATGAVASTPQHSRLAGKSSLAQSRQRSGSQESVSSVGSSASTASRSRVRLGVTGLNKQGTTGRASTASSKSAAIGAAASAGIQKVLKEKEEHIEQLLQERDLERSEVARAAVQIDETQSSLVALRTEYENYKLESVRTLEALQARVDQLEQENAEKTGQLDEEKRKVEDLEFTLEEETINKSDVEARTSENARRVQFLESELAAERERIKMFEKESAQLKGHLENEAEQHKATEKSANYYLDRIEELTNKAQDAEKALAEYNVTRAEQNEKLEAAKDELKRSIEAAESLQKIIADNEKATNGLQESIKDLNTELALLKETNSRQQKALAEAAEKQVSAEAVASKLTAEVSKLSGHVTDLEQQKASVEQERQLLEKDKKQLEQQVVDVMKSSGSSSAQVTLIEGQLQEREKKISELQTLLQDESKKAKKLTDQLDDERTQHELKMNAALSKYAEEMKNAELKHSDELRLAIAKQANAMTSERETFTKETAKLNEELKKKTDEVKVLQENLQHLKGDEEKIFKLGGEIEELKKENDRLDKLSRRVVTERDKLVIERDDLVAERDGLVAEKSSSLATANKQVRELEAIRDKLTQEKQNETQARLAAEESANRLLQEFKQLQAERGQLAEELKQSRDAEATLQREIEVVRQSEVKLKDLVVQTQQTVNVLQQTANEATALAEQYKQQVAELESSVEVSNLDRSRLLHDVESLKLALTDREQAAKDVDNLKKQVEDLEDREFQIQEEHEAELSKLQQALTDATAQLQTRADEVNKLTAEVKKQQEWKSAAEKANSEKKILEGKVKDLEKQIRSSPVRTDNNNSQGLDASFVQLQQDKESSDKQIEFLNSVIVELQTKVERLQLRLKAMEDGSVVNGGSDADNSFGRARLSSAPRLFCDICEVFDQHDTDDCPRQATSDSPPPTQHHGVRGAERPYCDICEAFGHSTQECDDEQTF